MTPPVGHDTAVDGRFGAPLIKKCAILSTGSALDQLYAGKCDECGMAQSVIMPATVRLASG
ncbi:hypothetical protein FFI16_020260 [Pseudomonas sp. KBS0710]|nr:hypothetical protein FFI16_020260 [Pseudomonas sp. KBS0710]